MKQHVYHKIFGWFSFKEIYSYIVKISKNEAKFVEVGCLLGKSISYLSVEIINSGKNIKLYGVDTWPRMRESQKGYKEGDLDKFEGDTFQAFRWNMKVAEIDNIIPIRMMSSEASKLFEDKSLDFVFIDAEHDYNSVKTNILSWLPKIKNTGYIGGHDYEMDSVKKAVKEEFDGKLIVGTITTSWLICLNWNLKNLENNVN